MFPLRHVSAVYELNALRSLPVNSYIFFRFHLPHLLNFSIRQASGLPHSRGGADLITLINERSQTVSCLRQWQQSPLEQPVCCITRGLFLTSPYPQGKISEILEKILLDYTNAFAQSEGQIAAIDGMTGMLAFDQISKEALGSGIARIRMYGSRSILAVQECDPHSCLFIQKKSKRMSMHTDC
jgi:hypothetical protein